MNCILSVTKPNITYQKIERISYRQSMPFTGMLCRFATWYDTLFLKEQVPRTQGG